MASTSQRQKGRDGAFSTLDADIQVLDLAKCTCAIPLAKVAFDSARALLATIRDSTDEKQGYVELGKTCAGVCKALDRGLKGRRLDELSQSVLEATNELTTTVAAIQKKIAEQGKWNVASRLFYAKRDKDKVAAWELDFIRILQVYHTELAINTHTMVMDVHRNVMTGQGGTPCQHHSPQASIFLGELPPPAPRACFGREGLIERVVGLAENMEPIALIGTGGIGKTSVALSVLHDDRIKKRFGENRRFIRCDQFPASRAHFLARLSKVIGAGVENPEDLAPLRPALSSKEMLIILDNAESILDPQGANARDIYPVVDELCQFKTISLFFTSRITTVPRYCKRPEITTLSMEAACDIFYGIYDNGRRSESGIIKGLLQRLDFHALSITLLATTASNNMWDFDRLTNEWDIRRALVLQADHNESLAATIELSLDSPTFRKLGPNARDLLGVIAFLPQGVADKNIDWLFPNIPDGKNIFDKFCVLSLAYRSNGFVTMLAPIRDYLGLQDPQSSSPLSITRDRYFSRLLVDVYPDKPGFEEARWIMSEDLNVEHLVNIFTSFNANSDDAWDTCCRFMDHLYWHKPRQTVLMPKIEGLPDDHRSKPGCLISLSRLFGRAGNHTKRRTLLTLALELARQRGDDSQVARALREVADANRWLGLYEEGIQQAREGTEIYKRLGDTVGQVDCLVVLAWLLLGDGQLDAAEDTASLTIGPLDHQDLLACRSHRVLGRVYESKGDKEKAIRHFKTALGIATPLNWREQLFWIHIALAQLFHDQNELNIANTHVERATLHVVDLPYRLGRTMEMQAQIWYGQGRSGDAKSEASHALEVYEKLGVAKDAGRCRDLLQRLNKEQKA